MSKTIVKTSNEQKVMKTGTSEDKTRTSLLKQISWRNDFGGTEEIFMCYMERIFVNKINC